MSSDGREGLVEDRPGRWGKRPSNERKTFRDVSRELGGCQNFLEAGYVTDRKVWKRETQM